MSGKPAEQEEPGDAQLAEGERPALSEAGGFPPERIGPVRIERLHKDDGRALILYTAIDSSTAGP